MAGRSGEEILIIQRVEFSGGVGAATERLPVTNLLDVAEATGDTLVAVRVEGIETQGNVGVHAGVHFAAVEDRTHTPIHDLGRGLTVRVDEVAARISIIVALGIAVAQRQFQRALRRRLTAELTDAFLDGAVDGGMDGVDRFSVGLGDDDGAAVLGIAAVDGLRFPDVGIGKTDEAGDDPGIALLCHSD